MRTRIKKAEEGSVLILGIGLLGVCLLALVVVADAGSAFLQRKNLYSVADAAALAGAQTLDLPIYYSRRDDRSHPTDGQSIQVDLSIPITVPFVNALHREPARVRATARLDYRTSQ